MLRYPTAFASHCAVAEMRSAQGSCHAARLFSYAGITYSGRGMKMKTAYLKMSYGPSFPSLGKAEPCITFDKTEARSVCAEECAEIERRKDGETIPRISMGHNP
jgi:hypothetical protein